MKELTVILAILISNALLLGGTAYIVFWMGFSGWWFVLSVLLLDTMKVKKKLTSLPDRIYLDHKENEYVLSATPTEKCTEYRIVRLKDDN